MALNAHDIGHPKEVSAIHRFFTRIGVLGGRFRALEIPATMGAPAPFLKDTLRDARAGAQTMARAIRERSGTTYDQARLLLNESKVLVERFDKTNLWNRCT